MNKKEKFSRTEILRLIDDAMLEKEFKKFKNAEFFYERLLERLTSYKTDEDSAELIFQNILEHKIELENKLVRSINFKAATLDYFYAKNPVLDNPVIIQIHILKQAEKMALTDILTGLYNRRYFDQIIESEMQRAKRYSKELSVLIIDLDNFKALNDTYGHLVGDEALHYFGKVLRNFCRKEDIACRLGGEEFVIILPETTSSGALNFSERLRLAVMDYAKLKKYKVTFSGGLATFPQQGKNVKEILNSADKALYLAKYAGKNKIVNNAAYSRRFSRFFQSWNVIYHFIDKNFPIDKNEFNTREISLGGLSFESDQKVSVGTKLMMYLHPLDKKFETIETIGIIRRCENINEKNYKYGVEFIELKTEQIDKMKKVLPLDENLTV